jgi:hypothetical protein
MITTTTMHDRFKYLYIFFWIFVIKVDARIINNVMSNQDSKMMPVFFRWSSGFELNGAQIRCATDRSSEDPSNTFLEAYPEMKGLQIAVTLRINL